MNRVTQPAEQAGISLSDNPLRPLDRRVAMSAAEWFVMLESGDADAVMHADFNRWHDSDPEHARAWSRIQHVSQRAGGVPSAIGASVLRRPETFNRRGAIKTLALLIGTPVVATLAWKSSPWSATSYAAGTGERRSISLPDGTQVELNTNSEIALAYTHHERLVVLRRGEILIETARDSVSVPRPFLVRTEEGRVRAIGTRFVVRQRDALSTVSVLQGAVEISPTHGDLPSRLDAGQQGNFSLRAVSDIREIESLHAGMWSQGILAVHDMRLDAFVDELARYRRGFIRCDASVAHLRITGAFQLADTDRILQNLIELLPVEVRFSTRYWTTIVAR